METPEYDAEWLHTAYNKPTSESNMILKIQQQGYTLPLNKMTLYELNFLHNKLKLLRTLKNFKRADVPLPDNLDNLSYTELVQICATINKYDYRYLVTTDADIESPLITNEVLDQCYALINTKSSAKGFGAEVEDKIKDYTIDELLALDKTTFTQLFGSLTLPSEYKTLMSSFPGFTDISYVQNKFLLTQIQKLGYKTVHIENEAHIQHINNIYDTVSKYASLHVVPKCHRKSLSNYDLDDNIIREYREMLAETYVRKANIPMCTIL